MHELVLGWESNAKTQNFVHCGRMRRMRRIGVVE